MLAPLVLILASPAIGVTHSTFIIYHHVPAARTPTSLEVAELTFLLASYYPCNWQIAVVHYQGVRFILGSSQD